MSALFIAQAIGHSLSAEQQIVLVLTGIVASMGTAGIPQAGLAPMIAVKLPKKRDEYSWNALGVRHV